MQKEIDHIIQLFPVFKQKIDFLFQTDENFRDLCEDYLLCVQESCFDIEKRRE